MPRINILDDATINKIAAGEVIERPSSIIKELVENSIDAGASSILIEIENGGKDLIKVVDNGCGIEYDDVNKAFMRHATSKISAIEDLSYLNTLGFRGEALASIAAVSKLEMITKTSEDMVGTKVNVNGGKFLSKQATSANKGTQISVKSLFYNTPARLKFLKSTHSESQVINDLVNKIAIGNPNVRIKYINNKKRIYETLGDGNISHVIRMIYGKDISENLIEINSESNLFKIKGYISNNNIYRSNRNMQHIYVNGRYVKSKNIMDIINDSYKAIIPINKFPIYIINIDMDPATVDVNIHPNKLDVKFDKEDQILMEIGDFIRGKLMKSSLLGKYKSSSNSMGTYDSFTYTKADSNYPKKDNLDSDNIYKPNIEMKTKELDTDDVFGDQWSKLKNKFSKKEKELDETQTKFYTHLPKFDDNEIIDNENTGNKISKLKDLNNIQSDEVEKDLHNFNTDTGDSKGRFSRLSTYEEFENRESSNSYNKLISVKENKFDIFEESSRNQDFIGLNFVGIIFDTYIMFSRKEDVILVDQHAAHERVKFEMYMKKFKANNVSIQMLIDPIIMELSPNDMESYRKNADIFETYGFLIEEYGHKNISIRGVPNTFGNPESQRFIYEILDNLDKIDNIYDTKYDEIAEIACKSAVKGNDKLNIIEARELIYELEGCDNPYTCPHGRPTMVKMTKYDVEKMFKRKL